ncbi:hypothetical protein ACJX0J_006889, partial [Zea mays]
DICFIVDTMAPYSLNVWHPIHYSNLAVTLYISFDCLFLCNLLLIFISCRLDEVAISHMDTVFPVSLFFHCLTGGMQLMHQFYNFSCLCNYIPFWITFDIDNHVGKNGFVTCVDE